MKRKQLFKRSLSFLLVIVLTITVSSVPTGAYVLDSHKVLKHINLIPHSGFGTETIAHFNEACYEWNKLSNKYTLQRSATQRHNETNFYTMLPGPRSNRIYRVANKSDLGPGQTRLKINSIKQLETTDININMAFAFSNGGLKNTYDVWTVFVHELGHVVGLDHVKVPAANSVMMVLPIGSKNRYPTNDDKAGINAKYK